MEKFIEKMVDVLDSEEEITAETILSDLEEWDSLSFMAMANAVYGKKVLPSDVKAAKTLKDLYELVK